MRAIYMKAMIVTCFCAALLLAFAAKPSPSRAQEQPIVMGYSAVVAYTTDHPIDPALMILATPDGRYSIAPLEGCETFGPGDTVFFYTDSYGEAYIFEPHISRSDLNPPYNCHIQIVQQVDTQPCLKSDLGYCDADLEQAD